MPVSLAMYKKSLDHIGEQLAALGLDLSISTFDDDGQFLIDGERFPAEDVCVDYLWLSSHIHTAPGGQQTIFDAVLKTKSIGVLQTFNAGLDFPFYKSIADRGITICNSDAQAVAISEYVMAQIMPLLHPIDLQRRQQSEREWKLTPFREISKTHWLIVGFGHIGKAVAARLKPFGATVSIVRRSPAATDLADRVGGVDDLEKFLPDADIVLLACPLNAATRDMADKVFFAAMKPNGILINIGRGPLVNDEDLIAALDQDQLATAILDVFHKEPLPKDDPLWAHPKVRLTPHTSFNGEGVQGRWDQLFLDNIQRFANGEPLAQVFNPADLV